MAVKRKLIEVSIPLDEINKQSPLPHRPAHLTRHFRRTVGTMPGAYAA